MHVVGTLPWCSLNSHLGYGELGELDWYSQLGLSLFDEMAIFRPMTSG
jgi:hypothetical protein